MSNFEQLFKTGRPLTMGILNVTPDSFSDGGRWFKLGDALSHAAEMIKDGADIIDVGGQSTRPGHIEISAESELGRVLPVLKEICNDTSVPVSVDTYYPEVARESVNAGAAIINDVSGKISEEMARIVRESKAFWVITCTDEFPNNCDIANEVYGRLCEMVNEAAFYGVPENRLIIDPGFGFGKTRGQDIALLRDIGKLCGEWPVLVGVSRKRMIGVLSNEDEPQNRDMASLTAGIYAASHGAGIIRAHNVKLTADALRIIGGIEQGVTTADE